MKIIQKIIVILCVLLLANFTLIGCESGHKHDFTNGICSCGDVDWERETAGLEYVELLDGTMEVSNYFGHELRVFIPEKKNGKVITSIGEGAFKGLIALKFVSMPNTITQIKKEAFYSCSGLKSIYIPNGVKSIGEMAFADCNDVITVRYNAISCDNVLIGGKSFYRLGATNKDVKLVIGNEVQKIPNGLFYGDNYQSYPYITKVIFEDNSECKEIGDYAFMHCRSLKTFDFGQNPSIERIGDSCFGNCMALENFFVPKSMKVLEKYFLSAANALQTVTFEDAEGWCVRKFDINTWDALYYKELTEENFANSLSLVQHYNGFYLSKVADPVPYYDGIHEHEFVNGVCRCWTVSEDHVHEYVNGYCACKDVTSDHVHRFDGEGICVCKATSIAHVHSYYREMCNCGLYVLEE